MSLTYKEYLSIALLLGVIGVFSILWQKPNDVLGQANATGYTFSTTSPVVGSAFPTNYLLKGTTTAVTSGTLGTVTITKTDTGSFCFVDATTTDINKRHASQATSSIQLACFPGSPTAGSYPLNIPFGRGLIMTTSGVIASTTVTWD